MYPFAQRKGKVGIGKEVRAGETYAPYGTGQKQIRPMDVFPKIKNSFPDVYCLAAVDPCGNGETGIIIDICQ